MPYITLVAGVIISCCAFIALQRDRGKSVAAEIPHSFQDAFAAERTEAAAGRLHELTEKVESQLADWNKQKETAVSLILRLEQKLEELERRRQNGEKSGDAGESENSPPPPNQERLRLQNEIFTLYEQGLNVADISRKVGRGKGEVRLILNLRKA